MVSHGYTFYFTHNSISLTDHVPIEYIDSRTYRGTEWEALIISPCALLTDQNNFSF